MCTWFETLSTLTKLNLKMLFMCENNKLRRFLVYHRQSEPSAGEEDSPPTMNTVIQEVMMEKFKSKR